MTNNEILQHVRFIFAFNSEKLISLFQHVDLDISVDDITDYLRKNGEFKFKRLDDDTLVSLLDGLIIELRGKKDGAEVKLNQVINNNVIFNKIKIALALKAEDILALMQSAQLELSKHELSAFFRKPDHKHYRNCTDETLLAFLHGLQLKHRDVIREIKE